jgi:hypothetical protein
VLRVARTGQSDPASIYISIYIVKRCRRGAVDVASLLRASELRRHVLARGELRRVTSAFGVLHVMIAGADIALRQQVPRRFEERTFSCRN